MFVEAQTAKGEPIAVGVSVDVGGRIQTVTPIHNQDDLSGQERMANFVANSKGRIYARNGEAPKNMRASSEVAPATIALHRDSFRRRTLITRADVVKRIAQASKPGGPLFSFAGQQAATADTMALATAQQRLEAGEDAEAVRQETGWHKGADGKWRFEINDADAKLLKESSNPSAYADIHWGDGQDVRASGGGAASACGTAQPLYAPGPSGDGACGIGASGGRGRPSCGRVVQQSPAKLSGHPDRYKIKLRSAGYRLVYEVRDAEVVVVVIAVGKRERNQVYALAAKR